MPDLNELVNRNRAFAANRAAGDAGAGLGPMPLFLLTCLDPRTDPAAFLGLQPGDAPVLRNAGGRVTDAVVADVAFIGQLAGVLGADADGPLFEVMVIHHTQCGTGLLASEAFRSTFAEITGYDDAELAAVAVTDPEATVRTDVARLRSAKQVNPRIRVSGHVLDLATGLLTTVVPA